MATYRQVAKALWRTLKAQALNFVPHVIEAGLRAQLQAQVPILQPVGRPYATRRWMPDEEQVSIDGAVMQGPVPVNAWAKYAIPKGLPLAKQKTLAIENEPHQANDFSGVIPVGYGKGRKTLLLSDNAILKVKGKTSVAKINYHFHEADSAGPHYDLVVEQLSPGTPKWELHIARGDYKGRYAFVETDKGTVITRMTDRGLVIVKPNYILKDKDFLRQIQADNDAALMRYMRDRSEPLILPWIVEQKVDGSLANAYIDAYRAHFRSHREAGETYYDRLPSVEMLHNRSRYWSSRLLFPHPDLEKTVLRGELYHPDGPGRMGGILNALPENAIAIQNQRGMATFHAWDLLQYRERDLRDLPYWQRRELLEAVVQEIRIFNGNWSIVKRARDGEDLISFYDKVVQQGLPWGEGVVIKSSLDPVGSNWYKIKDTNYTDFELIDILEGQGKYKGSAGALVVQPFASPDAPNVEQARGKVGSFAVPDTQRKWIWEHRDQLRGAAVKVQVQEVTKRGAPRAGRFIGFHEGKGTTEAGLIMYAETLAGGRQPESKNMLYRLKRAAGWNPK